MILRDQPYQVRCLLARTRRLADGLPTVWEAFRRGDLDAEQIRVIDRVARRVTEAATLAAIDDQVIEAAHTRTPKQLHSGCCGWWCGWSRSRSRNGIAGHWPNAASPWCKAPTASAMSPAKYRQPTPPPSTGCSPPRPAASAPTDPRTDQQRRSDLFADLLLGRLAYDDTDPRRRRASEDVEPDDGHRLAGGRKH